MTYQEAVDYINQYGRELEYDKKEKLEFLVFIAPTDPNHHEEFLEIFKLNYFNPNVIAPYINEDVCVMRVAKKYLSQAFIFEFITDKV